VPFLIAGATSVGQQLAAALSMGAAGVEIGTGFMATTECPVPQRIKDTIISPKTDERSTIVVLRSLKNTGRFYKNELTKEVLKIEHETLAQKGKGDFGKISHLMTGQRNMKILRETGDPDDGAWTCGMAAGMITTVPSCQEFIDTMVDDAVQTIRNQQHFIVGPSKL